MTTAILQSSRSELISRQDAAILAVLQQNAQLTTAEIAEKVRMSPTPCWRAVRRLQDSGIIEGIRASVDREKIGYGIDAFVTVQIDTHRESEACEFEKAVVTYPEIVSCHVVSGSTDYLIRVVATDMASFSDFSRNVLIKLPHVREVRTSFVLKEVKKFAGYPIRVSAMGRNG